MVGPLFARVSLQVSCNAFHPGTLCRVLRKSITSPRSKVLRRRPTHWVDHGLNGLEHARAPDLVAASSGIRDELQTLARKQFLVDGPRVHGLPSLPALSIPFRIDDDQRNHQGVAISQGPSY